MGGGIGRMANQELLATIRDRYQESSKKEKGRILESLVSRRGEPPALVVLRDVRRPGSGSTRESADNSGLRPESVAGHP